MSENSRRKLLGLLTAAGVGSAMLPHKWIRPVVEEIVLPAHAQLSGCVDNDFDDCCPDVSDDCDVGP